MSDPRWRDEYKQNEAGEVVAKRSVLRLNDMNVVIHRHKAKWTYGCYRLGLPPRFIGDETTSLDEAKRLAIKSIASHLTGALNAINGVFL